VLNIAVPPLLISASSPTSGALPPCQLLPTVKSPSAPIHSIALRAGAHQADQRTASNPTSTAHFMFILIIVDFLFSKRHIFILDDRSVARLSGGASGKRAAD